MPESWDILRSVIAEIRQSYPFTVDAWVVLPDHLHFIWSLPEGDSDFSKRWRLIKAGFSKKAKSLFHREDWMSSSKQKHRETTIWQRRFGEHQIRDEEDLARHVDYIHYNPVKHGYVTKVSDWVHSSFHRYVKAGVYSIDRAGIQDGLDGAVYGE
jgi:putative transposase